MKDLISRSYAAIRKRGLIKDDTTKTEFIDKISEEFNEIRTFHSEKIFIREVVDLAAVCINTVTHKGYDFIEQLEECIIHQETRRD